VNEFVNMKPSITERPLEPNRVAYITNRLAAGLAVPFNWAKAQIEGQPDWYRVNGQHSSTVLAAMNGQMPTDLKAHIDLYQVPNKAALVQLFRQFDPKASSRTPLDVTNAYASVNDELNDISRKVIKLASEAIWWCRREIDGETDTAKGDDRYSIVMEDQYVPYMVWLDRSVLTIKTPELRNIAVLAAAYSTYKVDSTIATEFWEDVARARADGDESDEPASVLDAWLVKVKEKIIPDVNPRHIYQACIFAWNAHVDEKPISKVSADLRKGYLTPKYPGAQK
jgi:hypothetical protein